MAPHFLRVAIFAGLVTILAGCHTVPLGDPEKSAVDPALSGWWIQQNPDKSEMLVRVMPYDRRTYIATLYNFKSEGANIQPDGRVLMKGWLTQVGAMTVMTFEVIDPRWEFEKEPEAKYCYYRVKKTTGEWIEATRLNTDFLKDTKTPEELQKKIADNVNNAELWQGSEPTVFVLAKDKIDLVKKIIAAYEPEKKAD